MIVFGLSLFLVILGLFFIALGLLFINYDLSPLKLVIKREDIYQHIKLGVQIIVPGVVLIGLAYVVFTN